MLQKRVLIITYYWPPSAGSGVQRWLKFAKYLPALGWQPVVYTPSNPSFEIKDESLLKDVPPEAEVIKRPIWEPYQLVRRGRSNKKIDSNLGLLRTGKSWLSKCVSYVRGNFLIPDPRKFWVKPSVKFLLEYLKENPVDAIVTTGPPHSMHLIGLELKRKTGLPWLVDMRDLWAQLDYIRALPLSNRSIKKYEQLEKEVLTEADKVVVVSPSLSNWMEDFDKSKEVLVANGYDGEDFDGFENRRLREPYFNICHTGLLNSFRNPPALWQALDEICKENSTFRAHLRLRLIGPVDFSIKEKLKQKTYADCIELVDYVSHNEVLKIYETAHLLLLMINNTSNAVSMLTGKLFEYLASGGTILAFGPEETDVEQLLKQTEGGVLTGYNDVEKVKRHILLSYEQFTLKIVATNNREEVKKYERRELTKKLIIHLEKIKQ